MAFQPLSLSLSLSLSSLSLCFNSLHHLSPASVPLELLLLQLWPTRCKLPRGIRPIQTRRYLVVLASTASSSQELYHLTNNPRRLNDSENTFDVFQLDFWGRILEWRNVCDGRRRFGLLSSP